MEIFAIIIVVLLCVIIIAAKKKKSISLNRNIVNPNTENQLKFYDWVKSEPFLQECYDKIKDENIPIKPEYEDAILQKLETGTLNNPYSFPEYFDSKFDYIVIDFDNVNEDLKSAYDVGLACVKNNELVYDTNHQLNPTRGIVQLRKNQWTLLNTTDEDFSIHYNFLELWNFEFSKYLSKNLIVFPYQKSFDIFSSLIKFYKIKVEEIDFIILRDLTEKFKALPIDLCKAANQFNIEANRNDRVGKRVVSYARLMGEMIDNNPEYYKNTYSWSTLNK